jgi:hypothetical protein
MSQSIFPTQITNSFNPDFWGSIGEGITTSFLNSNYLRFPVAQGSQTFPLNLTVSGITNLGETNLQTKETVENRSHYLNFSDSSSTGVGHIQKSANFVVNPSTGTLTTTGEIVATGGLTATGLIRANGGLTIGGPNHITAGDGTIAPTSLQRGYTVITPVPLATVSGGFADITGMPNTSVGAGVWLVYATIVFQNISTTLTTNPSGLIQISRGGAIYDTQNYATAPQLRVSAVAGGSQTSLSMYNIFNFTASNNGIKLQAGITLGAACSTSGTNNVGFLKAVKLA